MDTSSHHSILIFENNDRCFGLFLEQIREVLPAFEIISTPGIDSCFVGLITLHGEVMPVMDAARFIDNGRTRLQPRHKFIIVNGETSSAAVLVERVDDLVEVPKSAVDRRDFHSGTGKGIHGIFVHNDQMVIILDLESCLTDSFHAEVAQQEPVLLKLKKEGLVI